MKIPRLAPFIGGPIDGDLFRRVGKGFPAELVIWHRPSNHLYVAVLEGNRVIYRHSKVLPASTKGSVIE